MTSCPICTHPKRLAIDAAIADGTIPRTVPARFGITKALLYAHLDHATPAPRDLAPSRAIPDELIRTRAPWLPGWTPLRRDVQPSGTYEDGLMFERQQEAERLFKSAWNGADERTRQRLVQWVNEQLQQEEMGLS